MQRHETSQMPGEKKYILCYYMIYMLYYVINMLFVFLSDCD
jgi:hypothetical protein